MKEARGVDALALYRWAGRLAWPRSYAARVLVVAAGTQIPPLVCILYLLVIPDGPGRRRLALALVLVAVLAGMAAAGWAIRAMLAPVALAREAIGNYLVDGEPPKLPTGYTDEAGLLLRDLAYAFSRWDSLGSQIAEHAAFDPLTGLLNRPAALDRLQQSFSLAAREGQPISIGIVDIDEVSRINDRHGRSVGDRVLAGVATRLQASMRGGDWAARWEGDAFLLLLHTDLDGASIALERMRASVETMTISVAGARVTCTVSAGGASRLGEETPLATLRRAEVAVYRAKDAGHNRVRLQGPVGDGREE